MNDDDDFEIELDIEDLAPPPPKDKVKLPKPKESPEVQLTNKEVKLFIEVGKAGHELNLGWPAAWIQYSKDFKYIKKDLKQACHARLGYGNEAREKTDTIISAFPRAKHTEQAKKGDIDLLYCQAVLDIAFVEYKDKIQLVEVAGEWFLYITDLKTLPANVVYNACIAMRTPLERPLVVKAYAEMIKLGMSAALALCLSCRFCFHNDRAPVQPQDKLGSLSSPNGGHFWLSDLSSFDRIMKGDMTAKANPYGDNARGCTPCNVIWGQMDRKTSEKYVGKTIEQLIKEH